MFVGVNVSSRQLFRPDLVKEVRHILARAVMPKGSLRLEITELLVMENPEKATAVLRELSEAGAGLALDDFGTGYSSLSYLNQFTFDTIKVDRSFLQASGENGAGSVILRSVVALAHELGKNVVVEGIETEDDVGLLRTIGCEYGQGFYYGEPMSEREALQLLKVARRSEQRKKRRGLLRKRERAVAEETAEAPAEAAASPPAADPAPRTAGRPRTAAAATNTAARVSPASPAANGAAAPVPATASASPGAGQAPPSQIRPAPPAESAHPPAGPPPLPASAPNPAPLRTLPPTPLRPAAAAAPPPQHAPTAPAQPQANGSREPSAAPAQPRTGPPPLPLRTSPPVRHAGPPPLPQGQPRTEPARFQPAPAHSESRQHTPAHANGRASPDFSKLPPAIAESLARLAGRGGAPADQAPPATPVPTAAGADGDGKPPVG